MRVHTHAHTHTSAADFALTQVLRLVPDRMLQSNVAATETWYKNKTNVQQCLPMPDLCIHNQNDALIMFLELMRDCE